MAADITYTAEFKDAGSGDQLAASIASALGKAFARLGPKLAKEFGSAFSQSFKQANNIDSAVDGIARSASKLAAEFDKVETRLAAIARTSKAAKSAFDYDGAGVAGLDSALRQIVALQDEIAKSGGDPAALDQYRQLGNLVRAEATAARTEFQQLALAQREVAQNLSRDLRQEGRVQLADKRIASAQAVVAAQTAASKETALIRASAQQQVALTQASAKQRAAAFELVGRVVRSTERVIRSAFDGTSNVVSSAFSSMRRAATSTTTNIRQAFSNSNSSIRNDFSNSNSAITNSYSRSFKKNTSIVNNELGTQERRVKEFAREASEEISTIGLGRLGGFAALGIAAGRALSSGFKRASTLETAEIALTQLLGSAERAKTLLAEVTDVVTGTPFALDQFSQATTKLIAYNVEAEKIPAILRAAGDAAAIAGPNSAQAIDSILTSIGQINTVGRASLEEVKVIAEAGVPAFKILGNELGVTTEELRDLFEKGAVPAGVAIDALVKGITEGTDGVNGATEAFGGLAKSLGGTLSGSVANFQTSIARLGAGIITAFKEPFTAALGAATTAVDLLGAALKSLATAFANSAAFTALTDGLQSASKAFKEAKNALVPFFDFISGGIVLFSQLAAGLFVLRRVPLVISSITSAFRLLLSPTNLLITAGVLVASFFKQMYENSLDLRQALAGLVDVFRRVGTVAFSLARDAFSAIADLFGDGVGSVGGGVSSFTDKVLNVLIPALESLTQFLKTNVLAPLRNFARTIRTDVLPVLGTILSNAVEKAKDAFAALVEFVQTEVVPVVGPILRRAVEIGQSAFQDIYDFLSGTLVPFIKSNLVPVLAGLGAAVGALALTGGNLPLAGLVGVGAGIGAALANDDTRAQIFAFFDDLVDGIRERISSIFNGDVLKRVGIGVLKVANTIGRVLGDALSDRRLLTAVAAVAAAAVAVAAAFVVGFGEGIIRNIPDLANMLSDGIVLAFKAIASDPRVAVAVVAALFGAATIAKMVRTARATGAVLAQAISQGAVTAGTQGVGSGASGFFQGLIGGPTAIRAAATKAGADYARVMARSIQKDNALIRAVSGQGLTLDQARGAGGRFTGGAAGTPENLRKTTDGLAQLQAEYGKAAVSGARFRLGLKNIFGPETQRDIRGGLGQIGTAIRESGKELATAAGIVAGGAFAASFIGKALGDINGSGTDKLQAGLGLLATSVATGAAIGGPAGAAAGVAVAGVGFLSAEFERNAQKAQLAQERVDGYAQALRNVSGDANTAAAATALFTQNLQGAPDVVIDGLDAINFRYADFTRLAASPDIPAALDEIRTRLEAAGVEGLDAAASLAFLGGQVEALQRGEKLNTIFDGFAESADRSGRGMDYLRERIALGEQATQVARTATQAYRDKLNELNDVRIDGLKTKVDEARNALSEAGAAADAAKEKLRQYLSGETIANTTQGAVDAATIAIGSISESIASIGESVNTAVGGAEFRTKIAEAQAAAAGILADAAPATPEEAAALVAPLLAAAQETGGQAGEDIVAAINTALANYTTPEGQDLLGGLFDAEAFITEAETALAGAELNLEVGLTLPPDLFANITTEAKAAFDVAGADATQGFADGIDGSTAAKDAARTMAEDALAEARTAIDANSPSEEFAQLGRWSAQGFAEGINESKARVFQAAFQLGQFSMQGFRAGILAGAANVLSAARSVADRAAQVMRDALEVESPSKVTYEIGSFFGDGFAEGITDAANPALLAAVRVANAALEPLQQAGRNAAKAIGRGFAEEGPGFLSSVRGALDDALTEAQFYADQFGTVGSQIASALFGQFGGNVGGRPGAVDLEKAFLSILGNTDQFSAAIKKQTDQYGFYGLTFDRQFGAGRENRQAFLEAGQNIRDYAQTLIDGGRSAESAVAEAKVYRDNLIAVGLSTGNSAATFDEMIRSLGLADDQLNQFVSNVAATTTAVQAATEAERRRLQAEAASRLAAEQFEREEAARREREQKAADEARQRDAEEAERNRTASITAPVFRDLVVQTPTADPEAVALYVANRVAFSVRR